MSSEAFTIRTQSETLEKLDRLAAQLDRSRNYLVNKALDDYLAAQSWQIEKTLEGIAAADRGNLHDHDGVFDELRRKISATEGG